MHISCIIMAGGKSSRMKTYEEKTIIPILDAAVDPSADLMTDKSYVFHQPGKQFASHQSVYHMAKEYARGQILNNMYHQAS